MEDLIKALQILLKYANNKYPTHCEHDVLHIVDINVVDISTEDINLLSKLGFFPSDEGDGFISFKYGSA